MKNKDHLAWIDLEMTGLSPKDDRIIEIATIVTDKDLNILEEGPVFAIHQSDERLDGMDDWNTKQHGESGLTDRVRNSTYSEREGELATIAFLSKYLDKGVSPMCGNSICQDRRFLVYYMPELAQFFHYRHIDVSTLKELARRWSPEILKGVFKQSKHLALEDIKDSIDELIYFRKYFIKGGSDAR